MNYQLLNDFINNAISLANNIALKYDEIKLLELKGLFYTKNIKELKKLVKCENEFYNSYEFNNEELDYMISYFLENYNIDININLEELIHNQEEKYNPLYRVLLKISGLTNYFQTYEEDIQQDELYFHIEFQKNLIKNYNLVIESFISQYLKNESEFKEELLYVKYLLPFIHIDTEQKFLNELVFNKEIYLDYEMFGDFCGLSDSLQKQYIYLHLFDRFVNEVNDVLEINDVNFKDKLNNIVLSEIILKSIGVFFSDEFIKYTLDDLNEHIIRNAMCFNDNKLAVYNILNLNEIIKKDKENFSYLSLKLRK